MLVDSEPLAIRVSQRLLGQLGLHYDFVDMMSRFVGCSSQYFRETVEADLGGRLPDDWGERSRTELSAAMRRELKAVDGIEEVLRSITLPVAVASNSGRERIRTSLGAVGLLDRLEGVISSAEDVGAGKPEPDVYLHAAEMINVDPQRCIAIDDSRFGVVAAHQAGMHVLAFESHVPFTGLPESNRVLRFDDMRMLPSIIESLVRTGGL